MIRARIILSFVVAFWLQVVAESKTPTPCEVNAAGFKVGEVPATLKNGDLVFHDSGTDQSIAIKVLTFSRYSHVGIYLREGDAGYVYEAHSGVQKTPIAEWSARPNNKETAHQNQCPWKALRLSDHPQGLSDEEAASLKAFLVSKLDVKYDLKFQWNDDKLYCSELVWKAYEKALHIKVGEKQTFAEFDLTSAEGQKLASRYENGKPPLNEEIVTPEAIYKYDKLSLVPPLTER